MSALLLFCRIVLAVTFAWSAAGKLRDMPAFRAAITSFELLPARWSAALAWAVLAGELAVVGLLVIGWPVLLAGFALAAGLLLVFSIALGLVLRRSRTVSCHCFGPAEQPVSWYDLVRNALLIGCGLVGGWSSDAALRSLSGDELALLLLMALGFVVLVTHVGDIVETLRQPFLVE